MSRGLVCLTALAAYLWISFVGSVLQAQLEIGEPGQAVFADGAFRAGEAPWLADVNGVVLVDLSQAPDGSWLDVNTPAIGQRATGVYDCEHWAVVFKFTEVYVPAGVSVRFKNHNSLATVVWLVDGDVHIEVGGAIDVSGENGKEGFGSDSAEPALPGPGGFRGGLAQSGPANNDSGSGLGPGGGAAARDCPSPLAAGGSYLTLGGNQPASSTYGNNEILPLLGGSGGGGGFGFVVPLGGSGGAGGGALLIVARGALGLDGAIRATGGSGTRSGRRSDFPAEAQGLGSGGGSGGAIRLVANEVVGVGSLSVLGGSGGQGGGCGVHGTGGNPGGAGRIRIEAKTNTISNFAISPVLLPTVITHGAAGDRAAIWPEDAAATPGRVRIVGITKEQNVPEDCDLNAKLGRELSDVSTQTKDSATVWIETENVPLDWKVTLRVVSKRQAFELPNIPEAMPQSGDERKALWSTRLTLPQDQSLVFQARARK